MSHKKLSPKIFFKNPWFLCCSTILFMVFSFFILFEVSAYYKTQRVNFYKAQHLYEQAIQQQENYQKWEIIKKQNQKAWERLANIEKMKTISLPKIKYLLERLAQAQGLTDIFIQCDTPLPKQSNSLHVFPCTLKGKALTDKKIFQFISFLTKNVPSIPYITTVKIKRIESLTPTILGQIANKKPISLFSVHLTIEWLFMKETPP